MLFILRLTNGDCVITSALGEEQARKNADRLCADGATQVATVRPLTQFTLQLSPTDQGSLDVQRWDDGTLDGILASEYPLLEEAFRRANAAPFKKPAGTSEPDLAHLKSEYERNTEIIREGLVRERQRFQRESSPPVSPVTAKKPVRT